MTPAGVQGVSEGRPRCRRPDVLRMKPVHVFGGIDRVDDLVRIDVLRQRKLNEDAVDVLIAIEPVDLGEQIQLGERLRKDALVRRAIQAPPPCALCSERKSRTRDRRATRTTTSTGWMPSRAIAAATSSSTCLATRFPSMRCAGIALVCITLPHLDCR